LIVCLLVLAVPAFSQETSIGLVLTGGGSFGAFEAGAVQAFFDYWAAEHCPKEKPPCEPPIKVIAGSSTGALIGPFVALGASGVKEVVDVYRNTSQGDILSIKAADILPFALFANWSSSVYGVGPLRKTLAKRLFDSRLTQIAHDWPGRRLVVLGTDFGTGLPAPFSSDEIQADIGRFREGILASTISPLATPPAYIKNKSSTTPTPNLDGGIHAVAPFKAFFDVAARPEAIAVTHLVVISAYPQFPTPDSNDSQRIQKPYPSHPKFGAIGARMDAVISESSISKEIALVWAAIELRNKGLSAETVYLQTGFNMPTPPRSLIVYAPQQRLGWDNLRFNIKEMREMADLGLKASPRVLIGALP
jgi:predicted acylesterase/phospholipase RssA